MTSFLRQFSIHAIIVYGRCCMAHNLPHYSYYKYGVIPRPLPRYPEKALIKRLDAVRGASA
ncbi:hypothetical protein [Rickettsia endosymbiont of Orchestes rusci]|uniref:hypothetical protein n=1 Tax=Rickettsia endosymbiont of Orchestes rusci TaxID=3066250 RepID=UPI00313E28B1